MNKFFLDSAYAIALSAVTDQYHKKAEILARQIETDAIQMITTRAVILEIGNAARYGDYKESLSEIIDETTANKIYKKTRKIHTWLYRRINLMKS
jgi:predicted nucleic acid-binding protein